MKNRNLLILLITVFLGYQIPLSANNLSDDFNTDPLKPYWFSTDTSYLKLAQASGVLSVTLKDVGKNVQYFGINAQTNPIDLSKNPRIAITLKSDFAFELRSGLFNKIGEGSFNGGEFISKVVSGDGRFHTYYFDFSEHLADLWIEATPVNISTIHLINFYVNLTTANVSGTFQVDDIKIGEDAPLLANGLNEDYTSATTASGWSDPTGIYTFSIDGKLILKTTKPANNNAWFTKSITPLILDEYPFVQLSVTADKPFSITAQLLDKNGKTSSMQTINYSPVAATTLLTFDFTEDLRMPSDTSPDAKDIVAVRFIINSDGEAFTGDIQIEQLNIGKEARPDGYEIPLLVPVPFSNIYTGRFTQIQQTSNGILLLVGADPNNQFRTVNHFIPSQIDMSEYPYLTIKVRASEKVTFRIDIVDNKGAITNATPIVKILSGGTDFETLVFDYTDLFRQSYPSNGLVDPSKIRGIYYTIEPGGKKFSGTIEIASVSIGSKSVEPVRPMIQTNYKPIKLNQLGYFPGQKKTAVVPTSTGSTFTIIDAQNQEVFSGILSKAKYWTASQEMVKLADFSAFNTPGSYQLCVPGIDTSYVFSISNSYLDQMADDVVKAFYYQRSGLNITEPYAEGWPRAAGHPDTLVQVHSSAATEERPEGTIIRAPKGWYDAGDYNKYIVNSSVACYNLMAVYERFPTYFKNRNLNIPESENTLPDILDEVKYNLDWMLTMQDADGGVYHKLTSADFNSVYTPPSEHKSVRYVVKKSTPATLDFAAVMAQAYRVYINFPELRDFAQTCLTASLRAYSWAKVNKNIEYNQVNLNKQYDPDINTGEYGESYASVKFADEVFWAATEIAIATQDPSAIAEIKFPSVPLNVMDWPNVYAYGMLSLSQYGQLLGNTTLKTSAVNSLTKLGDELQNTYISCPYKNTLRIQDFMWGSNTYATNEIILLNEVYYQTGNQNYLDAAIGSMDYVLGKNPTGYSYVSGAGSHTSENLYMAVGLSNENKGQIPGFMAGGPHVNGGDSCTYEYKAYALTYSDSECSYSTNEVAINWNSSISFAANELNALMSGYEREVSTFEQGDFTLSNKAAVESKILIYPNPAENLINIELPKGNSQIEIFRADGVVVKNEIIIALHTQLDIKDLSPGVYIMKVSNDKGTWTEKVVVKD